MPLYDSVTDASCFSAVDDMIAPVIVAAPAIQHNPSGTMHKN